MKSVRWTLRTSAAFFGGQVIELFYIMHIYYICFISILFLIAFVYGWWICCSSCWCFLHNLTHGHQHIHIQVGFVLVDLLRKIILLGGSGYCTWLFKSCGCFVNDFGVRCLFEAKRPFSNDRIFEKTRKTRLRTHFC